MTDDATLRQTLAAYLLSPKQGTPDYDSCSAAWDTVDNWVRSDPETAWRFIEIAYRSDLDDKQILSIAAGPLEEFLPIHGDQYFDRLETAVRREARARFMVAGVWRGGMSNGLWERFLKMREKFGIKPL
jgi:nitroreductase